MTTVKLWVWKCCDFKPLGSRTVSHQALLLILQWPRERTQMPFKAQKKGRQRRFAAKNVARISLRSRNRAIITCRLHWAMGGSLIGSDSSAWYLSTIFIPLKSCEWEPSHSQQNSVTYRRINSPLSPQRNNCPVIALLIRLLLNLCAEGNRTHNAIPKLLIQYRLVRISIILHNLIQPVDQRLDWRHGSRTSSVGETEQLLRQD